MTKFSKEQLTSVGWGTDNRPVYHSTLEATSDIIIIDKDWSIIIWKDYSPDLIFKGRWRMLGPDKVQGITFVDSVTEEEYMPVMLNDIPLKTALIFLNIEYVAKEIGLVQYMIDA